MRKFLLIALLVSSSALADTYTVSDANGNKVRLFDEPCDTPSWMKMKKAYFFYQGKEYKACWATLKSVVIVFDESGDITPIPVEVFRKEAAI